MGFFLYCMWFIFIGIIVWGVGRGFWGFKVGIGLGRLGVIGLSLGNIIFFGFCVGINFFFNCILILVWKFCIESVLFVVVVSVVGFWCMILIFMWLLDILLMNNCINWCCILGGLRLLNVLRVSWESWVLYIWIFLLGFCLILNRDVYVWCLLLYFLNFKISWFFRCFYFFFIVWLCMCCLMYRLI